MDCLFAVLAMLIKRLCLDEQARVVYFNSIINRYDFVGIQPKTQTIAIIKTGRTQRA